MPSPGSRAAWFTASRSLFGLLPPFPQYFLPAIAQLALFRLAQPSARVGVDDQHPMTRSRAGARLVLQNPAGHDVPQGLQPLGLVDDARSDWLFDHAGNLRLSGACAHGIMLGSWAESA
jgi:hypothetical protein